mmetsp:Transcript_62823/g.159047  ORF Transcript_62823/g.159047 Transcript_62823/m.159047 type:complete len:321 (-) Transcript_62823:1204-2166(-)
MGYLRTRAVRRSTISRSLAATWSRKLPVVPTLGRHTDIATLVTSSSPPKVDLKVLGSCSGGRSAATERCKSCRCAGSSSTINASKLCHTLARLPDESTRRPQAGSICLSSAQSLGCGLLSTHLLDRMLSNTSAPTRRGAPRPGESSSNSSSSLGALNGSMPLPSRCTSPALGHGRGRSSQAASPVWGPSKAQARQRRCGSPEPRRAWAIRRLKHSPTTACANSTRRAAFQPSTSRPAAATAKRSVVPARDPGSSKNCLASPTTSSSKVVPEWLPSVEDSTAKTARALCSSDSNWLSVFPGPETRARPKRLKNWRSETPAW